MNQVGIDPEALHRAVAFDFGQIPDGCKIYPQAGRLDLRQPVFDQFGPFPPTSAL